MNIKELLRDVESEIINGNTELKELQSKVSSLSQLLPNKEKLNIVLDSSTGLYSLIYKKKRGFFYETVEIFKNFHNLAGAIKDVANTGLLNIFDNIEENCFYNDKDYETEKKAHFGKVVNYENQLSEVEKKIFSEIDNVENLYYEIYSNLLFETMLIVSGLLSDIERTKKTMF